MTNADGETEYEGFAVDLVTEISKMLNFTAKFRIVADKKHGSKLENGEWNGMIGELLTRVRLTFLL